MFNIKPASDQRPVFLGLFVHSEQVDKVIQGSNYSKINKILISLSDMCERLNLMNPFPFKRFLCPCLNPFSPESTIVTFIHYKPRIAVAILACSE